MSFNTYPQQTYGNLSYGYNLRNQQYGNWTAAGSGPLPQVRPVSSIDEARASPIDFDGSIFYFPDIANKKIYTKQIGLDGSALLNMYTLQEIPSQSIVPNVENFVSKEEFQQTIQELLEKITHLKGEIVNEQPDANVAELKF